MRRSFVVAALSALAPLVTFTTASAQEPGETVTPFDKKKGGSEKVHRLSVIPANQWDTQSPTGEHWAAMPVGFCQAIRNPSRR